ncbi:MAG: aminopeptidase [Candidatus Marinamargulisbacteria bacterium]|jgi:aminopeptidase
MTNTLLNQYALLLTHYCLAVQPGHRVLIRTTHLAEPLLRELQKTILAAGGFPEFQIGFDGQAKGFYEMASDDQLGQLSTLDRLRADSFDALVSIDAPFSVGELKSIPGERLAQRQKAYQPIKQKMLQREAAGELNWVICNYPTPASAEKAEMSFEDYEKFVYNACFLYEEDAVASWHALGAQQQKVTDHLNTCSDFVYKGPQIDVRFSTENRKWINSNGRRNMPSGEVFTSPVEDSVEGEVFFTYPIYYLDQEIGGVKFEIEKGEIVHAKADVGNDLLQALLETSGARRFGEVAIGNNHRINQFTKSILFDEKIGGTIHMAIGASYPETGGVNQSSVHLDLIADMRRDATITADQKVIYENGQFIPELR